jgi:hypothetical protein
MKYKMLLLQSIININEACYFSGMIADGRSIVISNLDVLELLKLSNNSQQRQHRGRSLVKVTINKNSTGE